MSYREERRLFPPPRRKPSLAAVLVRWRVEVLAVVGLGLAWYLTGALAIGSVIAVAAVTALISRTVRYRLAALAFSTLIPHRVRSGLLQAGVTDRTGRLPWLMYASTRWPRVHVQVWLRAGITVADVRGAVAVLQSACGAAHVEVVHPAGRHDRLTIIVCRPQWGLPARK